ncbi:uncharacterized protein LOC143914814 isoform X2 [Arctopsyche grandis]|uniref:uncharacterized protein LOC143914814 isoform X2 n=1 Tax=Arctopsyche grandis TaxID=121162 RepID=UPI00406D9ACA
MEAGVEAEETIVMTPKSRSAQATCLIVERRAQPVKSDDGGRVHVAGGHHTGIIINKDQLQNDTEVGPWHASVEFVVYLVEGGSGKHTREARGLRSWFKASLPEHQRHPTAQDFFRDLVTQDFPKDYVGFIKKIMKLMQHTYTTLQRLEVELRQLEEGPSPPPRPLSSDESTLGLLIIITTKKVLELIEASYPNPITPQEMASAHGWSEEEVNECFQQLVQSGEIKAVEHGAYTRHHETDTHIQVVKQMPTMISAKQPSIAIITALYCEKLAVDAMVDNKETFVRYTTVGESNVYTLGNIGAHRVVSTKLPSVGHTREAMTAAGNTTTRLLGTFQKVDHVFLVGVAGGVPHYTDYARHVRLGDVVVSTSDPTNKYVYVYCEKAKQNSLGGYDFETRPYKPKDDSLLHLAKRLCSQVEQPWVKYLEDGASTLGVEAPGIETDKLYVSLGDQGLIEVAHPTPAHNNNIRDGNSRVQLGPLVGVGSIAAAARGSLTNHCNAVALTAPLHPVLDSVIGNCRDSFICIRGISDYQDGSRGKEWQPYSSLVAAAVMKSLICAMDPPSND